MAEPIKEFPSVSIIVLNWNGCEDTLECLASLRKIAYPNFHTIVVDNGSVDGSVQAFRTKYTDLQVMETGENLGYAGGNNVGIEEALRQGAEFILILNNDTVVGTDLLDEFVKAAHLYPDAGVLSGKIYCFSDPLRIWYDGARWVKSDGNFQYLNAGGLDDDSNSDVQDIEYASGCAMFLRADIIRRVGVLDPKFFLTFEETDWCYRVRRFGYRCLLVPKAKVWHKGSVSFGGENSPLYLYFYTRNRLLWAERHLKLGEFVLVWRTTAHEILRWWFAPMSTAGMTWKEKYWSFCAWMRHLNRWWQTPGFWATRLAVRDYLFRRFGDCPLIIRELNRAKL